MRRTVLLIACIVVSKLVSAQNNTINNGIEYSEGVDRVYEAKHIFFNKNEFSVGDVTYFGKRFHHVLLKYDIYKDELVTLYRDGSTQIVLFPEQVDSFSIYGQTFVKIDSSGVPKGYYARILQGNDYTLYARYTKDVNHQQFVNGGMYDIVTDHEYYYLKQADEYHAFKTLKGLGELLNASKKLTKAFQKNNPAPDQAENQYAQAYSSRLRDYCLYVSAK